MTVEIVQVVVQGGFAAVLLLVLFWQREERKAERDARIAERLILEAMRDSLVRIESSQLNDREEARFLRESFRELTAHLSDLMQRWRVADAIHELHNQEQAEVHVMATDLHKAIVDRQTGVHRLDEIRRGTRERAEQREELMRQSTAPPPRRRG